MFPSSPYLRIGLSFAFIALLSVLFYEALPKKRSSLKSYEISPPVEAAAVPAEPISSTDPESLYYVQSEDKVHHIVDRMPLFPGADCGDIKDFTKRKQCSNGAMLKYIYKRVKYPKKAKDESVEGMAVVSFVIEKHGVISRIKVVRDPGAGLGRAAAKVVEQMKEDNVRWEPGLLKGKPVRVQFNLPVKFKLK